MQSSVTVTVTVTMGIYHSFFSELLYTLVKMSTTEYYYDDDVVPMTPEVQIPSAIGLVLLIIIAIGGNALTIAAYLKDRYLNTVYDFYIFNLGVTDLLLSCISMPFYAVYTLTEFTWPFGYGFCKVWMVIDFTLCFESIMIMLILSLDRLLMITMGSAYMIKITKVVAWVQIVISWSISFLVYGPAIIGWNYWVGYSTVEKDDCDVEFAYDHMYTTATSIVEFVLPFVCLTFINCLIYIKIRKRIRVSPNVPKFISVNPTVPNFIYVSQTVPKFICIRRTVPKFIYVSQTVPEVICIRHTVPKFIYVRQTVPEVICIRHTVPKFISVDQTDPRSFG